MKKILLVDDEPELIDTLQSVLEPRGCKCFVANNGKEALGIAKKEKPDLIILDLIMPEMDGIATSKALKADTATKDIPVIAYTAQEPEVVAKKGREAFDVLNVLMKPFDARALIHEIEKVIGKIGEGNG